MDRDEAKTILVRELTGYRKRSYGELLCLLEAPETKEVKAPSGDIYQLEFQAVWDNRHKKHLRIIAAIDDGGFRAFVPLTRDFILTPEGTVVGEEET